MSRGLHDKRDIGERPASERFYYSVVGAGGEMAAAKALGLYWPGGVDQKKSEPDIPLDWQVRTRSAAHFDLIVRDDDRPDHKYILVTGDFPTFNVLGGLLGRDARRPEWLGDKRHRLAVLLGAAVGARSNRGAGA